MECYLCKGTMQKGATVYNINRHGYHFVIDQVPAWVCNQCGEAYFEEEEVGKIQDIIQNVDVKVDSLVHVG